jgi:hypothetical protein
MINPKIIRFDELQYYTKKVWKHVKNVYVEYVYDANQHTYVCELQPSYWLIPYNTDIVFKKRTNDETIDTVRELICWGNENEPMYIHTNKCNGFSIDMKIDEDTTMEDVVDYLSSNPPYFEDLIQLNK